MDRNSTTGVFNVTVRPNGFSEEYKTFNYIMIGASFGLLLIVLLVTKGLCVWSRNHTYKNLPAVPVPQDSTFIWKLQDGQAAVGKRTETSPKEQRQYGYDDPPINIVPDSGQLQENPLLKVAPIYSKIVTSSENMPRSELTRSGVCAWATNPPNQNIN